MINSRRKKEVRKGLIDNTYKSSDLSIKADYRLPLESK